MYLVNTLFPINVSKILWVSYTEHFLWFMKSDVCRKYNMDANDSEIDWGNKYWSYKTDNFQISNSSISQLIEHE